MKTVIYLDELLLTNFAIGAALLLGVGLLSSRSCTGWRLCAGAVAAAASSLVLLLPEFPFPLSILYKFGSGAIAIFLTYGWSSLRSFLPLCAWYLLLNFLLCGAIFLPGIQFHNGSIYLPLSPGRLLFCCTAVYGVLRFLLHISGHPKRRSMEAVLELSDEIQLPVRAFYDTGFSVQEPLSQRALVLVSYPAVKEMLSPALRDFLELYFAAQAPLPPPELGIRLVPCKTISGHCLLPAVPAKALHLHNQHTAPLLAVFCSTAPDEHWSLLFGADVAQMLNLR